MDTSIVVARIIGPLLLVNGVAMLLNGKSYKAIVEEFLNSRALVYLAGFMTMFIGLEVVNAARPNWPLSLRVIGWLFVIGGALRMLFTSRTIAMGKAMLAKKPGFRIVAGTLHIITGLTVLLASHMR